METCEDCGQEIARGKLCAGCEYARERFASWDLVERVDERQVVEALEREAVRTWREGQS